MSDGHAVVHDLAAVTRAIPRRHVTGAHLELEGRCHAVAHHHAIRLLLLAVLVEVDEPGRHNVPGGINHADAFERRLRQDLDRPVSDSNMANGVEP